MSREGNANRSCRWGVGNVGGAAACTCVAKHATLEHLDLTRNRMRGHALAQHWAQAARAWRGVQRYSEFG